MEGDETAKHVDGIMEFYQMWSGGQSQGNMKKHTKRKSPVYILFWKLAILHGHEYDKNDEGNDISWEQGGSGTGPQSSA